MKTSLLKEYVEMMLLESRLDDLKAANPNVPVDELWAADPSPTKKYVAWMVKQVKQGAKAPDVTASVLAFHKAPGKFKSKDINAYKTAKELEDEVKRIETEGPSKNRQKKEHKSGATKIQEGENFVVYRMDSKNACVQYGKGTKWCITMANQNYYEDYSSQNVVFYFILPKDPNAPYLQRMGFDYSKVAIAFFRDEDAKIIDHECYDAQDSKINDLTAFIRLMEDAEGNTVNLEQIEIDAEKQPLSFEFAAKTGRLTAEHFLRKWNSLSGNESKINFIRDLWNRCFNREQSFKNSWNKVRTEFGPLVPDPFWRKVLSTYDANVQNFELYRHDDDVSMPDVINNRKMEWHDAEGRPHRDGDLPASVWWNGDKYWYKHGQLHRDTDKPAKILSEEQAEIWYKNGKVHRMTGPAIIAPDESDGESGKEWFINGTKVSQQEFEELRNNTDPKWLEFLKLVEQ